MEHASLATPDLIEALAEQEVPVAAQPHFILSDWWIVDRLGPDRARWTYPFRSMLEAGVKLAFSSDSPVEPLDPWRGAYAAVGRGRFEGLPIWCVSSSEALEPEEALRLYVAGGELGAFEGRRLEPGAPADVVILNVREVPKRPEDLLKVKARLVIVDGEVVYGLS